MNIFSLNLNILNYQKWKITFKTIERANFS